MIKEIIMYTVICDNCGTDVNEDAEFSAWNDKNHAQDVAMEANWLKEGEKHYCDDCYNYGEEDELILKEIILGK